MLWLTRAGMVKVSILASAVFSHLSDLFMKDLTFKEVLYKLKFDIHQNNDLYVHLQRTQ